MKYFIQKVIVFTLIINCIYTFGNESLNNTLAPISDFIVLKTNQDLIYSNKNSTDFSKLHDLEISITENNINDIKPFQKIDITSFKQKSFKMNQIRSYISSVSISPKNFLFRKKYSNSFNNPEEFQKEMLEYMSNKIQEDETLEDDIHYQSGHLEQAGVELIANAIDAMGDFTGRFGIGFLQILQELKDENDRIEVCTKKEGFDAIRIIFIKINNEYRVGFKIIEKMTQPGTTIHVIKNNFSISKKNKLINYIRRKIRLSRKVKIIRKEDNKYFLMNHLNDFKLINGDSINTYEINQKIVLFEIKDSGYTISDMGKGMNIDDILEKLLPSRRSNNNYWFKEISSNEINQHTAIFYKESFSENSLNKSLTTSTLSLLVNGYEIETHNAIGLNLPEEFVLDLPIAVSQIESRDHLVFNKQAVHAFQKAIDKICMQDISIETKISLINAIYAMIDSYSIYEKNREYTKKIQNYCKKNFRENILNKIDIKKYQLLPNTPEFEGLKTGKKKPLYINPNLIKWSLPTISGMKIVKEFISQNHRLFSGDWVQKNEGPIYVRIGDDIIINSYFYSKMSTKLSKLLINLLWNAHTSYGERQKEKGKLAIDEEWFKIQINKDLRPKIDDILLELEADKILSKDDISGLKLVFTGYENNLTEKLKIFLQRYKNIKKIISETNIPLERVGFVKFIRSFKLKDLSKNEKKFDDIQTISRPFKNYPNILSLRVSVVTGGWYNSERSYYTFLYDLNKNEWIHVPELQDNMIKGHIHETVSNGETYLKFDKMYENSSNKQYAIFRIDKNCNLQPCTIKGQNKIWFKEIDGPSELGKHTVFVVKNENNTKSIIDLKTGQYLKIDGIKYTKEFEEIKILYNQKRDEEEKMRFAFIKLKNNEPFIYDFKRNKILKPDNFLDKIRRQNDENVSYSIDSLRLYGTTLEVNSHYSSKENNAFRFDLENEIFIKNKLSLLPDFIQKENPMNIISVVFMGKEHYICYIDNEKACIIEADSKTMKSFEVNGELQSWFSNISLFTFNEKQVLQVSIGDEYGYDNFEPYKCAFFDIETGKIIELPFSDKGWFNAPIEFEHIPGMGYSIMAIKDRESFNYIDLNTMKDFDFSQYKGMPNINSFENDLKNDKYDYDFYTFLTSALKHVDPLNGEKGDYWIFSNGIIVNQKKKEFFFNYIEILYNLYHGMDSYRFGKEIYINNIILDRYVLLVNRFIMSNFQYYLFDTKTKQFIKLPDYLVYGEKTYASVFKNRLLISKEERNHLYDFLTDKIIPLPTSRNGYFDDISIVDENTLLTVEDGETRIIDFLSQPSLETGEALNDEMIEIAKKYVKEFEDEFSDNPKLLETYLSNLLLGKFSKIDIPFNQLNPLLPFIEHSQLNLLTKETLKKINENFLITATYESIEIFSQMFDILKNRVKNPNKFSDILLRWMDLVKEDEKEAKYVGDRLKEFGKYFDDSLSLDSKDINEGYLAEYIDYLQGNGEILSRKRSVPPLRLSSDKKENEYLNTRYDISLAQLVLAVQNRRNILRKKDLTIREIESVLKEFDEWNKDPVLGEIFSTIFGQDPHTWIREVGQNARDAVRTIKTNNETEKKVYLDSYIDKNNHWAFTITDPLGVELWELINLFFIPGASGKRGKNELSGKFGKGLLTIFADADEIEVITSPSNLSPSYKMTLKVERNYDGRMKDIKITSLESIKTDFKGTRIKRIKYKPKNIEALVTSRSIYRYLSGIKDDDTTFYYKGVKVNENLEEIGSSQNEKIGKVSINLSEFGFSRIIVDGLYLDEITNERLTLVHEIIKKMFYKDELVISLSDKVSLLSTRGASQQQIEDKIKNGIAASMLKAALTLYIQKGRRIPDLPQDFFTNQNDIEHPDKEKISRISKDAELINEEKWDQVDLTPYTGTKREIIQLLIRVRDIHNAKTLEEMRKMDHEAFNSLNTGNHFMNVEGKYRKDEIEEVQRNEAYKNALKDLGLENNDDKTPIKETIKLTNFEKRIVFEATRILSYLAGYPEAIIDEYEFEKKKISAGSTWVQNNKGHYVPAILWNFSSETNVYFLKHLCEIICNDKIPIKERDMVITEFLDIILHEITHFSDKDNMSHEAEGIIDDAFITRFKSTIEKFIRMEFSTEQFLNYITLIQSNKKPDLIKFDFKIQKKKPKQIKKQFNKAA